MPLDVQNIFWYPSTSRTRSCLHLQFTRRQWQSFNWRQAGIGAPHAKAVYWPCTGTDSLKHAVRVAGEKSFQLWWILISDSKAKALLTLDSGLAVIVWLECKTRHFWAVSESVDSANDEILFDQLACAKLRNSQAVERAARVSNKESNIRQSGLLFGLGPTLGKLMMQQWSMCQIQREAEFPLTWNKDREEWATQLDYDSRQVSYRLHAAT